MTADRKIYYGIICLAEFKKLRVSEIIVIALFNEAGYVGFIGIQLSVFPVERGNVVVRLIKWQQV